MRLFQRDVEELWRREDYNAAWKHPDPRWLGERPRLQDDEEYQQVRQRVAKGIMRAERISSRLRVPVMITSPPPAVIAGSAPTIRTSMFEAILTDRTYRRIPRQEIKDDLNRAVGAVEDEVKAEWRHVWNPLWWLLHGPFMLLRSAGLDTERVERRLWSRVTVQLGIDVVVGLLAYLLLRFVGLG